MPLRVEDPSRCHTSNRRCNTVLLWLGIILSMILSLGSLLVTALSCTNEKGLQGLLDSLLSNIGLNKVSAIGLSATVSSGDVLEDINGITCPVVTLTSFIIMFFALLTIITLARKTAR